MNLKVLTSFILVIFSLFLAACGGGGGSASEASEKTSYFVYNNLRSVSVTANIQTNDYNRENETYITYLSGLDFSIEGCEVVSTTLSSGNIQFSNGIINLTFTANLRDDCYSENGTIQGIKTVDATINEYSEDGETFIGSETFSNSELFSMDVNSKYSISTINNSTSANYNISRVDSIGSFDNDGGYYRFKFQITDPDTGYALASKNLSLKMNASSGFSYTGSLVTDSGGFAEIGVSIPNNTTTSIITFYLDVECGDAYYSTTIIQASETTPVTEIYSLSYVNYLENYGNAISLGAQDIKVTLKVLNAQTSTAISGVPVVLNVVGDSNATIVGINNVEYKTYTLYSNSSGMVEYTLRFPATSVATQHIFMAKVNGSSSDEAIISFHVTQQ